MSTFSFEEALATVARNMVRLPENEEMLAFGERLSARLIAENPDLYAGTMDGPVMLIDDKEVMAKTRRLSARMTFDSWPLPKEAEDLIIDQVAAEIRGEKEFNTLRNHPVRMFVLAAISTSGIILDDVTGDPTVCFMTRYGTLPQEA